MSAQSTNVVGQPNKFMRAGYGKKLRTYLTSKTSLHSVIDFGDLPVFDATAYPTIVITQRGKPQADETLAALTVDSLDILEKLPQQIDVLAWSMPESALASSGWALVEPDVLALMTKLRDAGQPLEQYVDGKFYYGIKTGFNEAFVIDAETRAKLIEEDPRSAEIIKPWLRGRDVKRWNIVWANLYVIFTRRGVDIEQYPAVKQYLSQFRTQLTPKPKDWDKSSNGKWQGRKQGLYEWYEVQDNIAYFEEFEKPKIIYPDIAKRPEFAFDESGSFSGNTLYIIPTNEKALLAILNSPVMHFFYDNISSTVRGGYYRFIATYMKSVPIPQMTNMQRVFMEERVEILNEPNTSRKKQLELEAELNELVYEIYGLTAGDVRLIESSVLKHKQLTVDEALSRLADM